MSSKQQLYPLIFDPIYKDYIWGGKKIATRFEREIHANKIAESWELCDRPEGLSVVSNGPLKGTSLRILIQKYGAELIGKKECDAFPLLIKIIDARDKLSVQVHPDEAAAAAFGGEPKTEAWIILDAEPGAMVYAGFKKRSSKTEFSSALQRGRVDELLQSIPVKKGDVIFIPGGRVHCISAGCLLLEVQQNSNTTYRVYDWGRIGVDGNPRELHIEQALKVIHWDDKGVESKKKTDDVSQNSIQELLSCPYFRIERINVIESCHCVMDGCCFHAIFAEQGELYIETSSSDIKIKEGSTVLIPANTGEYKLRGNKALRTIR